MVASMVAAEKRKIPKIIVIAIILTLVVALLIGGFFIMKNEKIVELLKTAKTTKEETILLNEFLVNLKSENGKKSYLKVQIALMYNDKKDGELIAASTNKIRDIIINNLLGKTSEDIIDGDNINNLKDELRRNINIVLEDDLIKDVYITDFVIQ